MLRTRRGVVAAAALTTAVLAAGCGGGESSGGGQTSTIDRDALTSTTPVAQGDVDLVTWGLPYGEPTTVDPIMGLDYSPSIVSSQMCESMLKRNEDGSVEPNLASFEQVDDLTVVLTPRDDVQFWDGTPMTADDILYTLQRSAAPESYVNALFENVASMKKTGPDEVTVKFSKPDSRFTLGLTTYAGQVVQQKFTEKAGKKFGTPSTGVMCTGPLKWGEWRSGSGITLERNDDYWNDEWRARPARVEFRFFNDSTAIAQALIAGEIDGAYEVPAAVIPRLKNADTGELRYGPSRQYADLWVRRLDGPLGNPDVRRALNGVWDREGIARVVYGGAAEPAYGVVEPDSFDPEAREPWEAYYAELEKEVPLTPEEAKKLVEESGYAGEPVRLTVLSGDQTQSQLLQVLQESAKEIGVTIKPQTLQPTEYSEALQNKAIDAGDMTISTGWNGTPNPLELYGYLVPKDNPYNLTSWDNPEAARLLEQARKTIDPAKRAELAIEMARIYDRENLVMPLVEPYEVSFLNKRLTGIPTTMDYVQTPSLAKAGAADPEQ